MNTMFIKSAAKFGIFTAAITALLFVGVGLLILLSPQLIWAALTYAVGGSLLLLGLVIIGSLFYNLAK